MHCAGCYIVLCLVTYTSESERLLPLLSPTFYICDAKKSFGLLWGLREVIYIFKYYLIFSLIFSHCFLDHIYPHSIICVIAWYLVLPVPSIPSHSFNDSSHCSLTWSLGFGLSAPLWPLENSGCWSFYSRLLIWKASFPSGPCPCPLRPGWRLLFSKCLTHLFNFFWVATHWEYRNERYRQDLLSLLELIF